MLEHSPHRPRESSPYRGRFAPSPTGPLHFGSLVAALGSFLEARSSNGQWLLRMEDIDPPREVAGAADDILRTLEALGLTWDGSVIYQSARVDAYRAALSRLAGAGRAYPCACTRAEAMSAGKGVYPGTCRRGLPPDRGPRSWRLRVDAGSIAVVDRLQGPIGQDLSRAVGDYVLWRADGLPAYQLAVVVDDAWQGVSDVVRGCDLLESTPRQVYLQRLLGLPQPAYAHLPLAVNARGDKLSKQTAAPPVRAAKAAGELVRALRFLGQPVPGELARAQPGAVLEWALQHWRLDRVPAVAASHAPAGG